METLFCWALPPTVDARTIEAVGNGGFKPWPVRVNARVSTVNTPWASVPDCGVKVTWKGTDCPGPMETGRVRPGTNVKAVPETVTLATVILAAPVLDKEKFCVPVDPTSTDPKLTVAPALSGPPAHVTTAEGAAVPARTMLMVLMRSVALYEAMNVGLKAISISASDAGPTYGERM